MKYTLLLLTLLLRAPHMVRGQSAVLPIVPVGQLTPSWCWVSCGEMIFKYYGVCCINPVGVYQCGIIGLIGPVCNNNCTLCPVPAQSMNNIQNMLARYPQVAASICYSPNKSVNSYDVLGPLTISQVITEVDSQRPILSGINTDGVVTGIEPKHATLVVGYSIENGIPFLIINDPFPYNYALGPNPYLIKGGIELQPFQYKISYRDYVWGMAWNRSLIYISF